MRFGFFIAFVISGLGACSPLRFVAIEPPRGSVNAASGEAAATIVAAELHSETAATRYELETDMPDDMRLGMVYLNGAYEPRCSLGGVRAVLMKIDGKERWSGDPVSIAGRHRLDVDFLSTADVGSPGPRAIDIELIGAGEPQCLRVPLRQSARREAGWELTNTGTQGFGVDVEVPFHAVDGVTALIAIRYEIGLWAGPLRLVLQPGPFGVATCSTEICGSTSQGQAKTAPMIPVGAGMSVYPWISGMFALGVEARVRESFVWLPAETGTERFWVHSPQGVLHFAIVPPTGGDGLPGGPGVFSADLELPFGALIVHRDGRTSSAPMLGGGLMIHTWL